MDSSSQLSRPITQEETGTRDSSKGRNDGRGQRENGSGGQLSSRKTNSKSSNNSDEQNLQPYCDASASSLQVTELDQAWEEQMKHFFGVQEDLESLAEDSAGGNTSDESAITQYFELNSCDSVHEDNGSFHGFDATLHLQLEMDRVGLPFHQSIQDKKPQNLLDIAHNDKQSAKDCDAQKSPSTSAIGYFGSPAYYMKPSKSLSGSLVAASGGQVFWKGYQLGENEQNAELIKFVKELRSRALDLSKHPEEEQSQLQRYFICPLTRRIVRDPVLAEVSISATSSV